MSEEEKKAQAFRVIDSLMESGEHHAFSLARHLPDLIDCDRYEAKDYILEWCKRGRLDTSRSAQ